MSNLSFAWIFLVAAALVNLIVGLGFRAGRNRYWLALYRNPTVPRAVRNYPLVAPEVSALLLVALLATAPILLDLHLDIALSPTEERLVVAVGLGYFFFVTALSMWITYRPPAWSRPRWLAAEDASVQYVALGPNWFDKVFAVALGLPALAIGLGFVVWGLSQW